MPPKLTIHSVTTFIGSAILGRPRSFARDARQALASWLSYKVVGTLPDLKISDHGWLITINHYTRPGFDVWWNIFVLSAYFPVEIRWITTSALESDNPFHKVLYTPLTRWFLKRLGKVYGFFQMPAMPPRPEEHMKRAMAIRSILRSVRESEFPVIGFAPEGTDWNDGHLMRPFPGTGRFLASLANEKLVFLPVGTYEEAGNFIIKIGSPYRLKFNPSWSHQDLDATVIDEVMGRIAACRPRSMRAINPTRNGIS